MNTGPYSDATVQRFLNERFVPVRSRCDFDRPTPLMQRFGIKWTPTFLVHGPDGAEHHRFVGYTAADDLFAHLALGVGKILYDTDRFAEAAARFDGILAEHPQAGAAPEAAFLRGVAEYKHTRDPKALRRTWDLLSERYPQSEWTRRAEPYSGIPL